MFHQIYSPIFIYIVPMALLKRTIGGLLYTSTRWRASKDCGLSYKATHAIMIRLRSLLTSSHEAKMSGTVEIDEAFIGKGSKVYNWSSISTRKQPIIGLVERETGKARLFLVEDRKLATIRKLVLDNVELGSTVYTDSWRGYNCLSEYYIHEVIDHSRREYVRGDVHTNTIENLWGRVKRNIRGAHIKISAKYVQEYINEACWKNNQKNKTSFELFNQILIRSFVSGSNLRQGKLKLLRVGKVSVVGSPCNLAAV